MSPSPTTLAATTATTAPAGVTDGAPSGGPVGGPSGLDPQDAASRLARDGPNALEEVQRRSVLQRIAAMLAEPMFGLLVAAVVIYLVLGDLGEGAMLGVFVLAVLGLTFYQEGKSEASIAALRSLTQHQTQVVRGGLRIKLAARGVVCGDVVVLREGSRVPADGYLLSGDRLQMDESLLTGESLPVNKRADAAQGEACNLVFAGTFVVAGHALALVTATGTRTQIGKIGSAIAGLTCQRSHLIDDPLPVVPRSDIRVNVDELQSRHTRYRDSLVAQPDAEHFIEVGGSIGTDQQNPPTGVCHGNCRGACDRCFAYATLSREKQKPGWTVKPCHGCSPLRNFLHPIYPAIRLKGLFCVNPRRLYQSQRAASGRRQPHSRHGVCAGPLRWASIQ